MKKYILSIALILMLVSAIFVLTGCGKSSNEEDVKSDSKEETSQVAKVESKWYWAEDEDGEEIITDGEIELHIGDTVNYDEQTQIGSDAISSYISKKEDAGLEDLAEYTMSIDQKVSLENNDVDWVVLGLDEETGEILIVSEDIVYTDTKLISDWDKNYYLLFYKEGYANGIDELNNICEIFGYGEGASGARSMTVEDVNKLTGYDPETEKFGEDETYEYGMEITYTMTDEGVECTYENGETELNDDYNEDYPLKYYDDNSWKTLDLNESITLTNTAYAYVSEDYPSELIFLDSEENNNLSYWLASNCCTYTNYKVAFGYFRIVNESDEYDSTGVSLDLVAGNLGINLVSVNKSGIRPVVSLSSDIELSGSSSNGWDIE